MIPLGRSVSEDENVSQTISAVISHHPATLNPKAKKKGHYFASGTTVNGGSSNTGASAVSSSTLPSQTQTAINAAAVNHEEVTAFLINATKVLNNITVTCFGDDYAGTRDDYLQNTYKWVIKDTPVMVG